MTIRPLLHMLQTDRIRRKRTKKINVTYDEGSNWEFAWVKGEHGWRIAPF